MRYSLLFISNSKKSKFPHCTEVCHIKVEAATSLGKELTYENLEITKNDLSSRNRSLVFHHGNCYFWSFNLMICILF